jgi:hypothetical protein
VTNDGADDVLNQAERIAQTSDEIQQLRAALHTLVDVWPRDALGLLVSAVNEAYRQIPEDLRTPPE